VPAQPSTTSETRRVRVIVVAEVRLYREGMVHSLSRRDSMDVVGSATNREETLALIGSRRPEVIVLDMATRDSYAIARAIAAEAPEVKTVAFAVANCEEEIFACADAGVRGYLSCDASIDDLVTAVEGVTRGDLPVPPQIAAELFRQLSRRRQDAPDAPRLVLTTRERQILLLIEEGLSNKEIASRLNIEVATVKNHVHSLLTKMHVSTRGQAAARLTTRSSGRPDRSGVADARQSIRSSIARRSYTRI
jgi:two-component system, NarL family, nitrate/nitrite response regulator NarL